MLAVRKVPKGAAAKWEKALLEATPFDDLPAALVGAWIEADGTISIYVIDNDTQLPDVAMGLTMTSGDGPQGAYFLVTELELLKATKLALHATKGNTLSKFCDDRHFNVRVVNGRDVQAVISAFMAGEFRQAAKAQVQERSASALKSGDYDITTLGANLKTPITPSHTQGVCNSALRLAGGGLISISIS